MSECGGAPAGHVASTPGGRESVTRAGARAAANEPQPQRLVSIVVPMLNEAENVEALLDRFRELARAHPEYRFELVAIDDGSTDETVELLEKHAASVPLTIVQLSRNFGAHYALTAGLAHCAGDCAIFIGADLQEPPHLVSDMLAKWTAGAEVVWGVRTQRADHKTTGSLFSRSFNYLFHRYSELKSYPPEGPSGMLCDRIVIDHLNELPERNRNVLALIGWLGFRQTTVEFHQEERRAGKRKWTSRALAKLAVDSFVQFSVAPLRLATYIGLVVAGIGFLYAGFLIVWTLFASNTPTGWPTLAVVTLVLGGCQLVMLGIVGEYLWRVADDARRRPVYVVREVIRHQPVPGGAGGVDEDPPR